MIECVGCRALVPGPQLTLCCVLERGRPVERAVFLVTLGGAEPRSALARPNS